MIANFCEPRKLIFQEIYHSILTSNTWLLVDVTNDGFGQGKSRFSESSGIPVNSKDKMATMLLHEEAL
jgi:hypothetical protein